MNPIALVESARRRLRLRELLAAVAIGLVVAAVITVTGPVAGLQPAVAMGAGIVVALVVTVVNVRRARERWTLVATATHIEAVTGGLDNLLVAATALATGTLHASEAIRGEVVRQAEARTATVPLPAVAPLSNAAGIALAALAGASLLMWSAMERPGVRIVVPGHDVRELGIRGVTVTITPPAYLGREPAVLDNPERAMVPAGSRVRVDVEAAAPQAWLAEPGQPPRHLAASPSGRFSGEWTPDASSAVVLTVGDRVDAPANTRILNVVLEPDSAPRVRIATPGRDLAVSDADRTVELAIDASDSEALAGLRLAYVKTSGSGESFAFAEGEVPVSIDKASGREWHATARLSLSSMRLEDGDSVVYRALVRDSNPAAGWVESEAYAIEVGKRFEFAAATGSALPPEDRRYALSQQMVIVKTERLQGDHSRLPADAWAEQTRLLAMEQRMVRAEVVFLSGGEVEDEIAEAEQSSELQEGRLQNTGRGEMLRAINEMSRAEARLTAGDTAGALVFERAALAALQRAFDRRRYFLRTLGERSRIDPSRRLTGNATSARSSTRLARAPASAPDMARQLMEALARVSESGEPADPADLGRLAALETGSDQWRQLAAALAAALTPEARRDVAQQAMARLAARAWAESGASSPVPASSELHGWWREESRAGGRQ